MLKKHPNYRSTAVRSGDYSDVGGYDRYANRGRGLIVAGFGLVGLLAVIATIPEAPRLVGLGCGPDRATMVAVEEDEFPAPCYAIDTPQNMCGHDDASACADYMGQGY